MNNQDWYMKLDDTGLGIKIPAPMSEKIQELLALEEKRPSDQEIDKILRSINCHKMVLYLLGRITRDELYTDPNLQKVNQPDFDFTYKERVLAISDKAFVSIENKEDLIKLANQDCGDGAVCVGQIQDGQTGELGHSFVVGKEDGPHGRFICFDKAGFKHYTHSIHDLVSMLDFVNEKGEKCYSGGKWRFFKTS